MKQKSHQIVYVGIGYGDHMNVEKSIAKFHMQNHHQQCLHFIFQEKQKKKKMRNKTNTDQKSTLCTFQLFSYSITTATVAVATDDDDDRVRFMRMQTYSPRKPLYIE